MFLRKETGSDRLAKRLGVAFEPQTGNAAFDADVFVRTAAPAAEISALFSDPEVAEATVGAMKAFTWVLLGDARGPIAGILRAPTNSSLALVDHEERVRALDRLAAALPELAPASTRAPRRVPRALLAWSMGFNVPAVLGAIGWVVAKPGLDPWILAWPILASVVAGLVVVMPLVRLTARRAPNPLQSFFVMSLFGTAQLSKLASSTVGGQRLPGDERQSQHR